MKTQKTINLMVPICSNTGYGVTSTSITKAFINNGCSVCLFPIGHMTVDNEQDKKIILESVNKASNSWDKKNPCLKIWHSFELANRIGSGKDGALTFFEIDKIKDNEKNMMNNTDVMFVSSKWAVDILKENNITPEVFVCPLAVNTSIFYPRPKTEIKEDTNKEKSYKFINIGKWEVRKGHDILVEAFNYAFNIEDNVELYMINHNPFLSPQENQIWIDLYKKTKMGPKIKIIGRVPAQKDLAEIIDEVDCGVFPARAEGWNNEILEVMAMNKAIIATDYSAHTEYCSPENSMLIKIDKLVKADDGKFFDGFGRWADLGKNQVEQLVLYMRQAYSEKVSINENGLETSKKFTWEKTASILENSLLDI